jgi:VCBS repeat protein
MIRSTRVLFGILCAILVVTATSVSLFAETTASESLSFIRDGQYGHSATFQVALWDLDGDGDLDAVFANMHARSEIWLNRGDGSFTNAYRNIGGEAHGVGIGDLDGDGDLDIVLTPASDSEASRIYFNDGTGRFTLAMHDLGDTSIAANSIELFDADNDGDLDISVYYFDSQRHCRLYLNDSAGMFAATALRFPGIATWGDIDNDGDVDAVCLQHEQNGSGYRIFLNTGEVGFEESQHIAAPAFFAPGSGDLGDIDGDGDLDLVASGGPSLDSPLTILVNDGTGTFSYDPSSSFAAHGGRIALGDFNGDGAADAYIGCLDYPKLIGLSDRAGSLIDSGLQLGSNGMAGMGALGDLDGDGDLDLFIAIYGQGGPNQVWLNTTE